MVRKNARLVAVVGIIFAAALIGGCKSPHRSNFGGGGDPLLNSDRSATAAPGVSYTVNGNVVEYTIDDERLSPVATEHFVRTFEQLGKTILVKPRYAPPVQAVPTQPAPTVMPPGNGGGEKLQPVPEGYRPSTTSKGQIKGSTTEYRKR